MPEDNQGNRNPEFFSPIDRGVETGIDYEAEDRELTVGVEDGFEGYRTPESAGPDLEGTESNQEELLVHSAAGEPMIEVPAGNTLDLSGTANAELPAKTTGAYVMEKLLDHELSLDDAFADQEAAFNFNQENQS